MNINKVQNSNLPIYFQLKNISLKMKKLFMISFLLGIVTSCLTHMTLLFPISRAHPLILSGSNECIAGLLNKGKNPEKCAEQELKFSCGRYSSNSNIVTKLESGKTFNVSFFNLEFKDSVFFSKDQNKFLVNRDFFEKNHKMIIKVDIIVVLASLQ